jgi:aldehyde dehydrogenase (NAD+)
VERSVYEEFVDGVSKLANSLTVGNSLDPSTLIGPLVSETQLDRVTGYLDSGAAEGARATAGGARVTDGALADGYFVPPTVFADVEDSMRIAQEEIFGPVASILPFNDIDEVGPRANSSKFGLGRGVPTPAVGKSHRPPSEINTGVVWVNSYGNFDPAMPFGGSKMSGWGKELSRHSIDEYVHVKAVWINTAS